MTRDDDNMDKANKMWSAAVKHHWELNSSVKSSRIIETVKYKNIDVNIYEPTLDDLLFFMDTSSQKEFTKRLHEYTSKKILTLTVDEIKVIAIEVIMKSRYWVTWNKSKSDWE